MGCAFETLGGSAVLWSNYVRSSRVSNCSFAWLGGNAVLAMGTDQFGDATDGEHPWVFRPILLRTYAFYAATIS